MRDSWKHKVYRSWDEVDDPAFVRQWEQWMAGSAENHVFNHPSLVSAWTDTYRTLQDIRPLYIVAESEETTVFLPLVLWRRNWKNAMVRLIVPAGYSDYDYHDPVLSGKDGQTLPDSFWLSMENFISSEAGARYDEIMLNGIRAMPGDQKGWEKDVVECPYIDMSAYRDFEDFFSGLKKKLRSDINRRKRRIRELGELTYHVHQTDGVHEAVQSLSPMLEAHSKRRPKAYKAPGFHEALIRYGLPEAIVHFSELRLDGKTISWRLGFL
ncbi:MAG: GNAT family N-acetyltransferase, partial [Candidatus Omnitrophica bacterium]|nr:GNAT family N-acetyltransferase [Candidatus Omnitrophota bacterium]